MSNQLDVIAMLLSNTYTNESMDGAGAVKGAPCQIQSITPIEGGQRITFLWVGDSGTEYTSICDLKDGKAGKDGRGIKSSYVDAENHFIIVYDDDTEDDCGEITVVSSTTLEALTDVELNSPKNGNVLKYDSSKGKWVNGTGGSGGGGGSLEDDLTTSVTVGGIKSGTTYEADTPLETLFRDMLNPVAYPTLTNPSATLSATGAKLLETGSTLNTTMTIAFNRGSINPAYGTSGKRSGEATSYTLDGTTQNSNSFPITVTSAKTSYQGSVAYAQGEQPKDSTGKNYQSPLPAGSVNTNTLNYEFVEAMWANTSNIASVAKLSLVSKSAKQRDLSFSAQTVANPEIFDIPSSWTVSAIQVKNDLSGQYEDAMSQFTVTDVVHQDAGGTNVNYKRYTFNLGYGTGARQVRVKWN